MYSQLTIRSVYHVIIFVRVLERGYKNYQALISYIDSCIDQYREDARKALSTKEVIYKGLDQYLQNAYKQETPMKTTFEEVYSSIVNQIKS